METLWRPEWQPAIKAALSSYDPRFSVLISADINLGCGRGAVLVSGNDSPLYPYEERILKEDQHWTGGNSSNGPFSETVWSMSDSAEECYDVTFWLDVPAPATGVRVLVDENAREIPCSHGLAIVFLANWLISTPKRPEVAAYYESGWHDL